MGMFDDYTDESIICPCGRSLTDFQGKSGPRILNHYMLGDRIDWLRDDVFELHTACADEAAVGLGDHWVEGIGVVWRWRWIATIITKLSAVDDHDDVIWDIRTK